MTIDKITAREAIEYIWKRGEELGERRARNSSKVELLELIEVYGRIYEKSFKADDINRLIIVKGCYKGLLREMKNRGLDVSNFPEELNYLERQN